MRSHVIRRPEPRTCRAGLARLARRARRRRPPPTSPGWPCSRWPARPRPTSGRRSASRSGPSSTGTATTTRSTARPWTTWRPAARRRLATPPAELAALAKAESPAVLIWGEVDGDVERRRRGHAAPEGVRHPRPATPPRTGRPARPPPDRPAGRRRGRRWRPWPGVGPFARPVEDAVTDDPAAAALWKANPNLVARRRLRPQRPVDGPAPRPTSTSRRSGTPCPTPTASRSSAAPTAAAG